MGKVIKGWDLGLVGRCIKDKVRLTIPSQLGYGDEGAGHEDHEVHEDGEEILEEEYVIPPGATIVFDINILDVDDGEKDEPGFIKL